MMLSSLRSATWTAPVYAATLSSSSSLAAVATAAAPSAGQPLYSLPLERRTERPRHHEGKKKKKEVEGSERTVRDMMHERGYTPYNGAANVINCRGLGTCGTCAVEVEVVDGPGVSKQNWKERARLSFPPHFRNGAKDRLRLACQCRVLPGTEIVVSKYGGLWGHKLGLQRNYSSSKNSSVGGCSSLSDHGGSGGAAAVEPATTPPPATATTTFSTLRSGPIVEILDALHNVGGWDNVPPWLKQEMRSNQAGETGAVSIYIGALWALSVTDQTTENTTHEEAKEFEMLHDFAKHHRETEREHLMLINEILPPESRSNLLPVWRAAGFLLGAVSTLISPRQMYVTTDAVESFVEDHYQFQIKKIRAGNTNTSTKQTNQPANSSSSNHARNDQQKYAPLYEQQHEYHVSVEADAAILTLLEHCCEEEIEHRDEARERAGPARFGMLGRAVDATWRRLIMLGSAAAANAAKVV